ncbi:MAG: ATP-binding protein [Bacteroidota bacterium]
MLTKDSHKVNILIVDDKEHNLLALESLLSDLGQNIIKATSGKEALKQVLQHDLAMILMDVMMPDMDGFETAELIRQREKSQYIPIIFVTAIARDQQYAFKGYASGAVDYIYKPIISEILIAKVKVFVELHQANMKLKEQQLELQKANIKLGNQIRERNKIENLERLALVASKSFNAISITDKEGKTEWVNDGLSMLTGYTLAELIGTKGEVVREESKLYTEYIELVNQKKMPVSYEEKKHSKHGKAYWALTTLTPVLDDKGEIDKIITIESDITIQKQTEDKLIDANKKAKEAVRAKQLFLSNMSHEIRTPMNAVIGFTNVLLKTELNPKQKEYLSAIKTSGDTLIVLINDILDLAKVDAGKMTYEKIPFKPAVVITEILGLFETKVQEKNLKLINDYDPAIPETFLGDPVRLKQILTNLLSNAIKFTNEGKITVSVKLLSSDQENTRLEIAVIDTGIGIPEEKLNTICGVFQQATLETARQYGGTGLGLSISKKLIKDQGGKFYVKSKLNEGSTFSFMMDFKHPALEPSLVPIQKNGIQPNF